MKLKIEKVKAIELYKLFVSFNDSIEGILDLSHLSGTGVFKTWDINNNFFDVFISQESGAITWPDEIDIDTYNAYCKIKGISPENFFHPKKEHAPHL